MNPVQAGIVAKPDDYIFSSYGPKGGLRELASLDNEVFSDLLGKTGSRSREMSEAFDVLERAMLISRVFA